jgi:pantoate--beta-alanine ligase
MVAVIQDVSNMHRTAESLRSAGKRIGIVPTMGSLHEGHLCLIRTAKRHADVVITTIFVNPTQFGPGEDYERYPRDLTRDSSLASSAGTDYIFAPERDSMYPNRHLTYIHIEKYSSILEGRSRPGHFRGVATVVAKLFNIIKPHVAVFGQKDAQQVLVIRQMLRDLNYDIELVVAPIVREADGLALSSRNSYLTAEERKQAPVLFQSLSLAENLLREGVRASVRIINEMSEFITNRSSGVIDYISIADSNTLEELSTFEGHSSVLVSIAVRFGATRLIDNQIVNI